MSFNSLEPVIAPVYNVSMYPGLPGTILDYAHGPDVIIQ
jgi:hypothetical protein